ncbi:hypothetical protein EBB79_13200 [Parasedimentitalea marina]|uniref:Uncharacterized protein n=2 Tax=Parasedimentitalea marina TaxID=2483033 RepID=A0A3T0N3W7_9RHOB|nr:hypothetical protein EBB79_13200 [Parasedimentitalea marina]
MEAAGDQDVLHCNPKIEYIEIGNSFGGVLNVLDRTSKEFDNAVVVGAFGEGIGRKYAAQYPNIAYLDVLPSGINVSASTENYYALRADGFGSWDVDFRKQGIAAMDLSVAMANSFYQNENGSVHNRPFAPSIFGDQLEGAINSYEIDTYTNEVKVIGGRN